MSLLPKKKIIVEVEINGVITLPENGEIVGRLGDISDYKNIPDISYRDRFFPAILMTSFVSIFIVLGHAFTVGVMFGEKAEESFSTPIIGLFFIGTFYLGLYSAKYKK